MEGAKGDTRRSEFEKQRLTLWVGFGVGWVGKEVGVGSGEEELKMWLRVREETQQLSVLRTRRAPRGGRARNASCHCTLTRYEL